MKKKISYWKTLWNIVSDANYFLPILVLGLGSFFADGVTEGISNPTRWIVLIIAVIFILLNAYHEYKKQKKISTDTVHIPLVIKVGDGPEVSHTMTYLLNQIKLISDITKNDLEKYFSLTTDELMFEYTNDVKDFERLISFTRIIKYKMNEIEKRIGTNVKFHVAYYRRPTAGFVIGTMFRTNNIIIYQNQDNGMGFAKVAEPVDRKYKELVKEYKHYTYTEKLLGEIDDPLLIAIESASHDIAFNSPDLVHYKNIIHIKLSSTGSIPYDADWIDYSAELYNVINHAQTRFNHIIIAHAMPEALSILLGMAIENYWNIEITQFENGRYFFALNMQKIVFYS